MSRFIKRSAEFLKKFINIEINRVDAPNVIELTEEMVIKPAPVVAVKVAKSLVFPLFGGAYIDADDVLQAPEKSLKTLKVLFPVEYTGKIVEVLVWTEDAEFVEQLQNKKPDQDSRERYYGRKKLAVYPKNLILGARLTDDSVILVKIPDPQKA